MTRIARSFVLALLATVVALTIAAPAALAAVATPVVPWESVSFNVSTEADAPVLIVSGKLSDATPLPATVELAVPAGGQLQWTGEILGGAADKDPQVTPTKSQRDGQDVYTFTLTKARVGQLEVSTPPAVTINGEVRTVVYSQLAWTNLPEVAMAVRIPQTAQLSEPPTGTASLAPGPTGFSYYQQAYTKVKTGDVLSVSFSYTLPASSAPAASGADGGGDMIVPILFVGLALAFGAALVVAIRRKMNPIVEEPVGRTAAAKSKQRATIVEESEYDGFAEEDADQAAEVQTVEAVLDEEDVEPPAPRNKTALIGTLVIVAALAVAGGIAVSSGGAARSNGDVISKTLAGGTPCETASIAVAIPEGTDTAAAAEQLFAALAAVPSITDASLKLSAASFDVGYCESQTDETKIRAALAPTGYVTAGSAPAPSNEASGATTASGNAQ